MNMPTPADPDALTRLPQIKDSNRNLLTALESHPSFVSQEQARSGKIYFMHDFAKRTDAMFDSILNDTAAPDTPATRGSVPQAKSSSMTASQREELKGDAVGRCLMLRSTITDTSGMTAMMFGEQPGRGVELGNAVKTASQELVRVIEG